MTQVMPDCLQQGRPNRDRICNYVYTSTTITVQLRPLGTLHTMICTHVALEPAHINGSGPSAKDGWTALIFT